MRRRAPQLLILLALAGVCLLLWDDVLAPLFGGGTEDGERAYDEAAYLDGDGESRSAASRGGPSLSGLEGSQLFDAEGRPLAARAAAAASGGKAVGAGADVAFKGRVKDGSGAGAAEVKITLHGPGGVDTLETDANGAFSAALQPGRYKILFDGGKAGGLLLRQYMIDGAPKDDLEFALREPGTLDISVTRGKEPVVGAPLVLTARGLEDMVRLEGETDQTGHIRFEGLVPSRYDLEAQVPSGPLINQTAYASSGGEREVKLHVPNGVTLKGKVIAGKDGPGVGGAKITLKTQALKGSETYETEFETTADGTYEVMIPQGRPRSFSVVSEAHAPWPTTRQLRSVLKGLRGLAGKKPVTRNVILQGGAVLSGVVRTEDDAPIPGVVLRFQAPRVDPISVTTKGDGSYAVASLNPGRYDLQIETQAYFPVKEQALRVSIPGGVSPQGTEFDVVLVGARRLEGVVLDGEGKGVPGARVFIVGGGGIIRSATRAGRLLETFSDVAGRWVIADIPPNQNVTVRAKMGLDEAQPVSAPWEKPPPSPIKMMLQPTATLAGRVMDIVSRTSLRGVRVRLQPDEGDGRTGRTTYTNAQGEYSIVGLLPGGWKVTPYRKDYLVAEHELIHVDRGGEVQADLRLDPGLVFAGTALTQAGQPLRYARITVRGTPTGAEKPVRKSASTNARGAFRMTGLKPGAYTLTCWRRGYKTITLRDVRSSLPELRFTLIKR